MLERLVGMLQGKGGVQADRIGVELYFKSIDGFVRSIEEFNYMDVRKELAEENKGFAQLIRSEAAEDKQYSMVAELNKVFIEKESAKVDHFVTLHALMMAHANLVIVSRQDEDCNKYIVKFEAQRESAEKTIEQKEAIIASMVSVEELQEQKEQLHESERVFSAKSAEIKEQIHTLKAKLDGFEEGYFAEL